MSPWLIGFAVVFVVFVLFMGVGMRWRAVTLF
jgi:hypothetical protein